MISILRKLILVTRSLEKKKTFSCWVSMTVVIVEQPELQETRTSSTLMSFDHSFVFLVVDVRCLFGFCRFVGCSENQAFYNERQSNFFRPDNLCIEKKIAKN